MQAGHGLTDATAGMRFRVRGASCTSEQRQTQRLTTSPSSLMSSVFDTLGSSGKRLVKGALEPPQVVEEGPDQPKRASSYLN